MKNATIYARFLVTPLEMFFLAHVGGRGFGHAQSSEMDPSPLSSTRQCYWNAKWTRVALSRGKTHWRSSSPDVQIVQGLIPISCSNFLRPVLRRSRNTHEHSFLPIICNTSSHYLSFSPRTINQWNSIPSSFLQIVTQLTLFVSVFHYCLILVMFSVLLRPSAMLGDQGLCSCVWSSINTHGAREIPFSLGDCAYMVIGHSGGAPDLGLAPL